MKQPTTTGPYTLGTGRYGREQNFRPTKLQTIGVTQTGMKQMVLWHMMPTQRLTNKYNLNMN